jgi:predicted RNA-binding protein
MYMCEFKVILNGKEVWNDVIYAKVEDGKVVLRDVSGQLREFENCRITEVDVNATRLVLTSS